MPVFHAETRHATACPISQSLERLKALLRALPERAVVLEEI
ncbi:MAG: hypothetical protein U5S82_07130 [Gammaproteobacteria bacterium]|nr:hypothetical protein [Gammaproteobacteria bacterium]